MKILLSAYACEPNKGSEPEVGWRWSIELAKLGHQVFVLTRTNNKNNIEKVTPDLSENLKLNFIYYDLPLWARFWKKGGRGVRLYYFLWQIGAYFFVKKIHKREHFDKVHHVTFVSVRQPSFMGNLGIPFIFGPVAGGEQAPWRLRLGYSFRGWVLDSIRDILNAFVKIDPFMWMTFFQAEKIYVTSAQTKLLLPKYFHKKVKLQLAIGSNEEKLVKKQIFNNLKTIKILYIGRFLYWKGMHLGIPAFAEVLKTIPNAQLTLIGKGPDKESWIKLAKNLGVFNNIVWVDWVEKSELVTFFDSHNIFFFPSLHDSGGMVVLEAMANGLPVVCLDLGGPGVMVNEKCGRVIKTKKMSESEIIHTFSNTLLALAFDKKLYSRLKLGALSRSCDFEWTKVVSHIYSQAE